MIDFIQGLALGLVVGGIAIVFVYRNNKKKFDKVADKIDGVVEKIKE